MRRSIALSGLLALLAMIVGAGSVSASENSGGQISKFKHVFVIMMENTSSKSLFGNPSAPWINEAAHKYGLATNYFGVTHPSLPNYIAVTAGISGPNSDSNETLDVSNIVDQLESHGKSWNAYMQSYSLCTDPLLATCGNQLYERKHNPFVSFADVQSNAARMAKIVDLSRLDSDLASGHVANYVWISPDQCNDMHGRGGPSTDPCAFANTQNLIAAGDAFLSTTVGKIMSSPAWRGNSAIFIAWDETEFTGIGTGFLGYGDDSGCCDSVAGQGGGHVVSLVITRGQEDPVKSDVAYNHYSILRTVEQSWHLGCLGSTCDRANVPTMKALLRSDD